MNILTSAVAAACAYDVWPKIQDNFHDRWANVPMIGVMLCTVGLPNLMVILLLLNFAMHMRLFGRGDSKASERFAEFDLELQDGRRRYYSKFEAANMLFVEKVCNAKPLNGRMAILAFTKIPMLWVKVLILATSYDSVGKTRMSLVIAVSTGHYAVWSIFEPAMKSLPLLKSKQHITRFWKTRHAKWASLNLVVMVIVSMHTIGIVACKSHDFAVFRMSCT